MSRLIRMAPALVGLALAAPTAAHAGLPPETKAAATPWTPKMVPKAPVGALLQPSQPGERELAPTIDPGSQGIMEANHVPPPPGMAADGTCVDCQAGVLPVPAGSYVTYRSGANGQLVAAGSNVQGRPIAGPRDLSTPATAIARRGVVPAYAPAPPAVASLGAAPGYAVVGGEPGYAATAPMAAVGEPVPVGVMRTGYRPQGQVAPGGTPGMAAATTGEGAPGHAVAGGQGGQAGQAPSAFAGPSGRKRSYPGSMLKHLFGMDDLGRMGAEREAHAREAHAMMTYSANPGTTDVPVSAVYGR